MQDHTPAIWAASLDTWVAGIAITENGDFRKGVGLEKVGSFGSNLAFVIFGVLNL